MPYADFHTHTHFSFDSTADLTAHCLQARAAGMDLISVTNHFDFDGILGGIYPSYLPHQDRAEILSVREAFAPDLKVLHGIEMGQPHTYPHLVPHLLAAHAFDFVLASVHNLARTPDFYFLRYDQMTDAHCHHLLTRYFDEVESTVKIPGIHALAHLTYPLRYMKAAGKQIDLLRYEAQLRRIFHAMVENGVCLEINTSGLRGALKDTMPPLSIAALYKNCGGTTVTVGSDAHRSEDVGAGVKETTDALSAMGLAIYQPKI